MRILLLVDSYFPSTKSSARQMHDLAEEFVRQGHQPLLVAPDDTLDVSSRLTEEQGIQLLRVRSGRLKGALKPVRALNEWRLSSLLWRAGRDLFRSAPCDLIVFYSPTIFFGPLVRRLRRLWSCPTYLILRDMFPQWTLETGVLTERSLPFRFFRYKELQQYAEADVIGIQSPANVEYFRELKLVEGTRLEVLYNWTPIEDAPRPTGEFRRRLGLEGKVVFFYGGNIGVAQDMDNLLRLAESVRREPEIHLLLVGDGSEVERLHGEVAARGLDNVTLHPPVPQERYVGMLAEFDVGLITLDRRLKSHNFPGKLLGYLRCSLPVLASINPGNDLQDLLEQHDAGRVCLTGDDDRLRELTRELAGDAGLRRRIGANGRGLLESVFPVSRTVRQILESSVVPGDAAAND